MLVLTRRVGETILIFPADTMPPEMKVRDLFKQGPVRITLTRIAGSQARVGIVAPEMLAIAREEINERHDT